MLAHLFLHGVVFSHSVWINCHSYSVEIKHSALIRSQYSEVSVLTPIWSPWVFNNPIFVTISLSVPTNNLHYVLSVELEWVISSMIKTFLVSKEISENSHLSDNWSILENFLLDAFIFSSKAVVNYSEYLVVSSAIVGLEMIIITFTFCWGIWIALFWDETLSLSKIHCSIHITSITLVVWFITANDFLNWKLDFSLCLLANSILSYAKSCRSISRWTVSLVEDFLSAIWENLSPVVSLGYEFFIILSFAWWDIWGIRQWVLEKLFGIW